MTDNTNETIRRNTVTNKPKQEGKAINGTTVSELKAQFTSGITANTTAKSVSQKGATVKKAQTSSKKSNKKKKNNKKFKRSPTLHRFFSYLEKNFSLLTLSLIVFLILVAIFLTGIIVGVKVRHNIEEQKDISAYIQENATAYNIPYDVIYAVIETESSFRTDAVSSTGARGLMQITKITLEEINNQLGTHYSMNDLFDPKINVKLGAFYLSILYNRFGDFETVYAAYNAGPTIVAKWLADPNFSNDGKTLIHDKIPYPETKRYVEKVIAFQKNYLESHNS